MQEVSRIVFPRQAAGGGQEVPGEKVACDGKRERSVQRGDRVAEKEIRR